MTAAQASSFLHLLEQSRLVAILRLDDLTYAHEIVQTLLDANIQLIEFTMTNEKAASVVTAIRKTITAFDNGEAMIGLGSVRNPEEANTAIDAGAQFIVSPITRLDTLKVCTQAGIPSLPGALTPTEMALAWDAGATVVKVFPSRHLAPSYLRDCLAPMPYLRLMPTGGVDLENMQEYFQCGAVGIGMGSNLLDMSAIKSQDWSLLRRHVLPFTQAARKGRS